MYRFPRCRCGSSQLRNVAWAKHSGVLEPQAIMEKFSTHRQSLPGVSESSPVMRNAFMSNMRNEIKTNSNMVSDYIGGNVM